MPNLLKAVSELTKNVVLIGIPADSPARQPEPGEPAPPLNSVIGYRLETGDPEQNLPARPFLVPGVEAIKDKAVARLKKAGQDALNGDPSKVDQALHAVGLMGQAAVQAKITDGPFVPLAPRTLAQRRARGRTGERPLIDTGQLRRSVSYVIRKKGK
jgi:hypothetical protein